MSETDKLEEAITELFKFVRKTIDEGKDPDDSGEMLKSLQQDVDTSLNDILPGTRPSDLPPYSELPFGMVNIALLLNAWNALARIDAETPTVPERDK